MSKPGEPYQPSNGTEGVMFADHFCDQCLHDKDWRDKEKNPCLILSATLIYDIGETEYPKEWTHDAEGHPTCTAFVHEDKAGEIANEKMMKKREGDGQLKLFKEGHE